LGGGEVGGSALGRILGLKSESESSSRGIGVVERKICFEGEEAVREIECQHVYIERERDRDGIG